MKLEWDKSGEKVYETGVSNGVLYRLNLAGDYANGYAWNGLTTVTESPSGAESNKQYADNGVYLNLQSAEIFGGTIEAFTYPEEFEECDGTAVVNGVAIGQQGRKTFGFAYKTLIGNDLEGTDHGYKLHLNYGCLAAPTEKAHATVNDSPEATAFSWEFSTSPVGVGTVGGTTYKPTSTLTIDSTRVNAAALAALEDILFGTVGDDPRLPLPGEVLALFAGTITEVNPAAPTYDNSTHTITIPGTAGVDYMIDGVVVAAGPVVITEDTVVTAQPKDGFSFVEVSDDDWYFDFV